MGENGINNVIEVLQRFEPELLTGWMEELNASGAAGGGRIREPELRQ
jgi:hypothetical protein